MKEKDGREGMRKTTQECQEYWIKDRMKETSDVKSDPIMEGGKRGKEREIRGWEISSGGMMGRMRRKKRQGSKNLIRHVACIRFANRKQVEQKWGDTHVRHADTWKWQVNIAHSAHLHANTFISLLIIIRPRSFPLAPAPSSTILSLHLHEWGLGLLWNKAYDMWPSMGLVLRGRSVHMYVLLLFQIWKIYSSVVIIKAARLCGSVS